MTIALTPLNDDDVGLGIASVSQEAFAHISLSRMQALARAMPDTRSAVLFCLEWEATRQARFSKGALAGQYCARISAKKLEILAGKPLRTIRWALAKLKSSGHLTQELVGPGRTAQYQVHPIPRTEIRS
ncbi:MAG: hypothetical protein AMXMBFR7_36820 [Planctomycetota bacterium]